MTIAERVQDVLELVIEGSAAPERKMDDLGLDSLDFAQLLVDLDEEFDIHVPEQDAALCETVGELIALVEGKC